MPIPARSHAPQRKPLRPQETPTDFPIVPVIAPAPGVSRLARLKPWLEIVQGVLTIIAFLAGYYWFLEQRSDKPNLKLEQKVTQRPVAGGSGSVLLTLDVSATNIGKVKVELNAGQLKLTQINPPSNGKDPAPSMHYQLKDITLEPGESDQAIFRAVIIPDTVKTLQVSAQYPVPKTHNYWTLLSAVDIGDKEPKEAAATTAH